MKKCYPLGPGEYPDHKMPAADIKEMAMQGNINPDIRIHISAKQR